MTVTSRPVFARLGIALLLELSVLPLAILALVILYAAGLPGLEIVIGGAMLLVAYVFVRGALALRRNPNREHNNG
ncbi:MAG: hypothetical protein ACTHM8_05345 [Sphingomonas sp.]